MQVHNAMALGGKASRIDSYNGRVNLFTWSQRVRESISKCHFNFVLRVQRELNVEYCTLVWKLGLPRLTLQENESNCGRMGWYFLGSID